MDYLKLLLTGCALSGCLGATLDYDLNDGTKKSEIKTIPTLIHGRLPIIGGTSIDFSQFLDKPFILIFAQETCSTCIAESKEIISHLQNKSEPPQEVYIITALVGADEEIAIEWKNLHQIPWTVAIDEHLELFENYCPEKKTPCLLIQKPEEGIVFKNVGKTSVDEIIKITGPWY